MTAALPPLRFAAIGLDHRHIYDQVQSLLDVGGAVRRLLDRRHAEDARRLRRSAFPHIPRVDDRRALLRRPVDRSSSPARRFPATAPRIAIEAMRAGKDFMSDKPGVTTFDQLDARARRAAGDGAHLDGELHRALRGARRHARARARARRCDRRGRADRGPRARTARTARCATRGSSTRRSTAASSSTSPRTRSTSSWCSPARPTPRSSLARVGNVAHPGRSGVRGLRRDRAARRAARAATSASTGSRRTACRPGATGACSSSAPRARSSCASTSTSPAVRARTTCSWSTARARATSTAAATPLPYYAQPAPRHRGAHRDRDAAGARLQGVRARAAGAGDRGRARAAGSLRAAAPGAAARSYNRAMVAVLHAAPGSAAPQAVEEWLDSLRPVYGDERVRGFAQAWTVLREAAGELRNDDGEPLVDRALGTASILAALRFDPTSIRATLLLPLPALPGYDPEDFAARHGADVATLVNGVARMGDIRALPAGHTPAERAVQAENLRKMLLAMVEDVRVVLIKLAERTQALRSLIGADEARAGSAAREVTLTSSRRSPTGWASGSSSGSSRTSRFRYARARGLQAASRELARRAARRPRALHRRASSRTLHARARGDGDRGRRHGPAQAHLPASATRCGARTSASTQLYDIRAVRVHRDDVQATATRRWASSTTCGRRSPASSTTTSRSPRRTTTVRCTPR